MKKEFTDPLSGEKYTFSRMRFTADPPPEGMEYLQEAYFESDEGLEIGLSPDHPLLNSKKNG